MKFREYSKLNLSDVNKDVLKLWEQENVFAKSIDERDGAPTFVFYEGPPSANGMPGIHPRTFLSRSTTGITSPSWDPPAPAKQRS